MEPADRAVVALQELVDELERAAAAARDGDELGQVSVLQRRLERVILLLVKRGVLSTGDQRLLGKLSEPPQRVHLAIARDKRAVPSPPIDCAAHLDLCKARCCSMRVLLSADDVREGIVRWDLEDPYALARADDGSGYCTHHTVNGCECYDARPATCRDYDCREDRRVWLDYEQRIPAPLSPSLKPRY